MTSANSTAASPALAYLRQAGEHLQQIRDDLPRLIDFGERMARPLLEGGRMFIPEVAPWWCSEFCHRAGGMMGVVRGLSDAMRPGDLAYFALPDSGRWDAREDRTLLTLLSGPGHLFVNGREDELRNIENVGRIDGFTGGAPREEGSYALGALNPLVRFREFEQLVRGWSATGELIASCIRGGRMPTIYMSVWFEGALVRNASFMEHDNLKEPWSAAMFHEKRYIPPQPPGAIGGAFIDEVERIRRSLLEQQQALARAGQWLAEARQAGRRTWVVAVGHAYPQILEWPQDSAQRPLEWGPSFSSLMKAIPHDLGGGDAVLHLGYAPVDAEHLRDWLDRGVRLIHSSPYGLPPVAPRHENFLWLDLPWRPGDATVDVPGYSVRVLPLSSGAHTLAFFAILAEVADRLGWR